MKRLCVIALLIALLASPSNVRADVAPPIYPPGSNLQPGIETTQVRMVAETVIIAVFKDVTPESLGRARVTADFTMRNLGTADESMGVLFPITGNDGQFNYPEISNLQIKINGRQIQSRTANYPELSYPNEEMVPWAEFDVTFPAGQDVAIQVGYDLQGSGYYPYTAFYYILETGAGWKDTIGSADIILRLPYEASPQNVILDIGTGWADTTPGGTFEGNEVRWHYDNFEPGRDQPVQNMEFALVAPAAWQMVLEARSNVERSPNDGETWGMVAKAYKEVFKMNKFYRNDAGGEELYKLSIEAYEKCLSLKPNDAQWHAGFADLLAYRSYWDRWMSDPSPETYRALNEIHTALDLAPNDPVVREIAQNITYLIEGGMTQNEKGFDFPWLTQTPTARPPSTPTMDLVAESTATPEPVATETPQANAAEATATSTSPEPVSQKSPSLCGSAVFLPLMAVFWFARRRKPG
jgi:hypothetical protein